MADLLKPPRIFILFLLVSFGSLSAVLFTPAIPFLSQEFAIPESLAEWVISVYLVGYALGQLPYGPLANRFGRKKTIYIGIVISLIGNILCYSSGSFAALCFGRFVQALGAAVGLKIAFTMIGDRHAGASTTKAVSLVLLAFGAVPGVSVTIGGFILDYWSWQACFVFTGLYSIFLALICLLLPETASHFDREALKFDRIVHGYTRQFKDPFTMLHGILMGLMTGIIYLFASLAPYIGINVIGLSPTAYGLWNLLPSFGLGIGLYLAGQMADKTRPRIAMISGILLILLGTLFMGVSFANGWVHVLSLFGAMFALQIGDGVAWTFASAHALSEATDKAHASAVLQFTNLAIPTLLIFLSSAFSPIPILMPTLFFILVLLMIFVWFKLREHHLKKH